MSAPECTTCCCGGGGGAVQQPPCQLAIPPRKGPFTAPPTCRNSRNSWLQAVVAARYWLAMGSSRGASTVWNSAPEARGMCDSRAKQLMRPGGL